MTKYIIAIIIILNSLLSYSQVAITIPAEYEKSEKLLLVWPYSPNIDTVIAQITGYANQHGDVSLIYNPDNIITDTVQIRNFLISMGTNNSIVGFIPATTNTYWLRQFAPITGYGVFSDTLVQYLGNPGFSNYNQPSDDSLPLQLANLWNTEFVDYGLQFESTNIQYDGLRHLFVGDKIIDDNIPMSETEIRFSLNAYFNSGEVLFIPSLNQIGGGDMRSIDNIIRLLDFETIAITSIPDTLPDFNKLENLATELSSITNYFGYPFKIIRLLSPPNSDGTYPISLGEEFRSYTNSLIFNDLIIVPSFGLPEYDSAAYYAYHKQMAGYEVKLVDARTLTPAFGSIHTITKEIPQPNFLRILHKKVEGIQNYVPDFKINCLVGSGNEVENMWLYHKLINDTAYTKSEIHMVCPQHFAVIDKLLQSDTVQYYIEAISSTTQSTYPLSAPEGNFTFWFDVVSHENEIPPNQFFEIAPNPSNGNFKLLGDYQKEKKLTISIYNSAGQYILKTASNIGETIDVSNNLSEGYYTLIIDYNNTISKQKLIIIN